MLDKLQNCEECDEFECTCFCKCGLPSNECVCGFTEEDYMTLPDKLTKRIQELVPEIIDKEFINLPIARDITLEDVLVAIGNDPESEEEGIKLEQDIIQLVRGSFGVKGWHLNKPLHEQEKECIEFLYKLLVTDK